MENYDKEFWENKKCPKYDCKKESCKCGLKKVYIPTALGDDSKDSSVAPKNGAYCNAIVVYEANDHVYIYSTEGIPTLINVEGGSSEEAIEELEKKLDKEILDRGAADGVLQQEINDLKNSPDVVDIVATYADLQAYDTSKLGDNDIIRVLTDETHDGDSTYYRWSTSTSSWTYIGGISIAASTVFYADKSETGSTRHIYKDEGLTEGATVQDILDAAEKGQVIVRTIIGTPPSMLRYIDIYLQFIGHQPNWAAYIFSFLNPLNSPDIVEYAAGNLSDSTYQYSEFAIQGKLTAGTNISISGDTISATDTTYSNFTGATTQQAGTSGLVPAPTTSDPDKYLKGDGSWDTPTDTTYSNFTGTDGVDPGTSGLVPAPATTDAGKFLKADGTWDTVNAGPTVVQAIGDSVADVMSQNAVAKAIYDSVDSIRGYRPKIGYQASTGGLQSVAFGDDAKAGGSNAVAVGGTTMANQNGAIALGYGASTSSIGEMNIGTSSTTYGYSSSNYRLLSGVYDAQGDHDAVTLGQLNGRVKQNAGAPTTSTVGTVGQLLEDTTNGKLYQCTAIDTTDPDNPSYTWDEVGGGGGVTPVQTTGTSTTGVMSQDATTKMVYSEANPSTYAQGGAIYLGNLDANQEQQPDPALVNRGWKYFWALPSSNTSKPINNSICILGDIPNQNSGIAIGTTTAFGCKVLGNNGISIGADAQSVQGSIAIGFMANASRDNANNSSVIAIGNGSQAVANRSISIGAGGSNYGVPGSSSTDSVSLGYDATIGDSINGYKNAVALGAYSKVTRQGEVNIGLVMGETTGGYNNTAYRVIGGVHDGQDLHDAATVAQGNTLATAAPTTSTAGVLGQLYTDTTNMHTYQLGSIDTTDPSNPVYNWVQRW